MATATSPETKDKPGKGEPVPPEEKFWHKYSPHYEFPISNVASIALHVAVIAIVIYITTRLMKSDEQTPVPVRGMIVQNDSPGGLASNPGAGGGEPKKEVDDNERPQEPKRNIPEAELKKELVAASAWLPEMKENPDALQKIIQSPGYDRLKDLNDDLKKRLGQGLGGTKGKGPDMGMGVGDPGPSTGGQGGPGDATTSGNRSLRWTIVFRTSSGKDYLEQLNAFKAKVVIPEPPAWNTNRLFDVITEPNPGKPLRDQDLPKMHFIDSDATSAAKVARALGLDFDPPKLIAFFPKDIEDELAAKERAYRNRKEDQIYSTTFRVLQRDGKWVITVTDQIPVRK